MGQSAGDWGAFPWESFRTDIEAMVLMSEEARKSKAGRKPFDCDRVIFRTLVLRSLHNLADKQIESQVRDRLSFTGFLRTAFPSA